MMEPIPADQIEVTPPTVKGKKVRDYSLGSLRDHISRATSLDRLSEIQDYVLAHMDEIPSGSLRKIAKAGRLKEQELRAKRIIMPESGLILPPTPTGTRIEGSDLVLAN